MPILEIGDRRVEVGQEFLRLSPEEQQKTVNGIASQIGIGAPAQSAPQSREAVAVTPGEKQFKEDERLVKEASGAVPGGLKAASYSGANALLLGAPSHAIATYTALKEGKSYEDAFKEQKRYEEALERQYPKSSMAGTAAGIGASLLVPMGAVGQAGRALKAGTSAKLAGTAAPEVVKRGAASAAEALPMAGVAGAMTGVSSALERPVTDIDAGKAVTDAAIGAGIGQAAGMALPALSRYFTKFPDPLDAAGNLKPEAQDAVRKAFEGRISPADMDTFKGQLADVFRRKGISEAGAVEALAMKEGAPTVRSVVTGQRPTAEASDIAEKGILGTRDVIEDARARMTPSGGTPTAGAEAVHSAFLADKAGVKQAYETVEKARGKFTAPAFDYFMPAIEKQLLSQKMPTSFEGTEKLFPKSAEAMKFLQEGIGSGNLPNANQPFNFTNIELVRRTLNKLSREASPEDARNIEAMKEGLFKGVQGAVNDGLFSGNGNAVIRDLLSARQLSTEFKNKFFDAKGEGGKEFRALMGKLVDQTTQNIGKNLPLESSLAAQRVLDTSLLSKNGGLAMYNRLERILGPNSVEMNAIREQVMTRVFNTGGDLKALPKSIDTFLKENGPIAQRVFNGQGGNPSISDLRRLSELAKRLEKAKMPNDQKEGILVKSAMQGSNLLAGFLVGNIHGMFAGTAAYLGATGLKAGAEKMLGASRRGAEEFGAPMAGRKAPEFARFLDQPYVPDAPVRNIQPFLEDDTTPMGYQAPTPLGGARPGRKAGGRVGKLSDRLVSAADRAKKIINNDTKAILNVDDSHVARALEIANRNLEG